MNRQILMSVLLAVAACDSGSTDAAQISCSEMRTELAYGCYDLWVGAVECSTAEECDEAGEFWKECESGVVSSWGDTDAAPGAAIAAYNFVTRCDYERLYGEETPGVCDHLEEQAVTFGVEECAIQERF